MTYHILQGRSARRLVLGGPTAQSLRQQRKKQLFHCGLRWQEISEWARSSGTWSLFICALATSLRRITRGSWGTWRLTWKGFNLETKYLQERKFRCRVTTVGEGCSGTERSQRRIRILPRRLKKPIGRTKTSAEPKTAARKSSGSADSDVDSYSPISASATASSHWTQSRHVTQ